jgi:hypothetical protein
MNILTFNITKCLLKEMAIYIVIFSFERTFETALLTSFTDFSYIV